MKAGLGLVAGATAILACAAGAQQSSDETDAPPPAQASALIESCSAHKFETTVRYTHEGKTRSSKVKLCGNAGQSQADWVRTLKDAAAKVQADTQMVPDKKAKIIAALSAEIAKLASAGAQPQPAPTFALKTNAPPPADPRPRVRSEPPPVYSVYQPLPPPKAASAASTAATATAKAAPSLPRPQLTIRCGDRLDSRVVETCSLIERNTVLLVRADENLPAGLSLRFLRKGDARGEVALAQLARGQSVRVKPPAALCAGVSQSRAEVQVLRGPAGSVVDSMGPYSLRC